MDLEIYYDEWQLIIPTPIKRIALIDQHVILTTVVLAIAMKINQVTLAATKIPLLQWITMQVEEVVDSIVVVLHQVQDHQEAVIKTWGSAMEF